MASPTFTRVSALKNVTTAGTVQAAITPTYTACSAGGTQVAIVFLSQTAGTGAVTCSGPGGNWSAVGSVNNFSGGNGDLYAYFFQNTAADSATSATFTASSSGTILAIVYEFGSTAGVDTANIFHAVGTGQSVGTGSGTAGATNDWQIIGALLEDWNLTPATAVSGFTQDASSGDGGNGGASFGLSMAVQHKTAVNSSATIASNTIAMASGSSGSNLGFTLLMKPSGAVGTAVGVQPGASQGFRHR